MWQALYQVPRAGCKPANEGTYSVSVMCPLDSVVDFLNSVLSLAGLLQVDL